MAPMNEFISQALGWASVGCWLVVGFPQFYEMFKWKTGEGMSLSFLVIWGIGDIFNLAGCILAEQLATQVAVAVWYMIMDAVLIAQIVYYDTCFPDLRKAILAAEEEEEVFVIPGEKTPAVPGTPEPSAPRHISFHDMSVPEMIASSFESAPRSFIHPNIHSPAHRHSLLANENGPRRRSSQATTDSPRTVLHMHVLCLLALSAAGLYLAGPQLLADGPTMATGRALLAVNEVDTCTGSVLACWWGQILGWVSSFFYIVARIPQLIKNFQRKSCEGLSVWMFFFGVMGNVTYSLSIVVWSQDPVFLKEHTAFLIGSLGTLAFDFAIFMQFFIYRGSPASEYQPIA